MSSALIALALGTLLAIGALAFVLYPLFFGAGDRVPSVQPAAMSDAKGTAVAALREIEFDRATGKLSDSDYAQLKARYTADAVAAMRREAAGARRPIEAPADDVEAVILAYRAQHPMCAACGPRPEADAIFCSNCGRYLPGACERCGARIEEAGAHFCATCGHRLAA